VGSQRITASAMARTIVLRLSSRRNLKSETAYVTFLIMLTDHVEGITALRLKQGRKRGRDKEMKGNRKEIKKIGMKK
jgi:hypothetical protein